MKENRYKNVWRKKLPTKVIKEKRREYFKNYYEEHKERILEKNKKRINDNRDRVNFLLRERHRNMTPKQREKYLESQRAKRHKYKSRIGKNKI